MANPLATSPQLQQLIGRAMVDVDFRKRLIDDVRGTVKAEKIEISEQQIAAIEGATKDPAAGNFAKQFESSFLNRRDFVA